MGTQVEQVRKGAARRNGAAPVRSAAAGVGRSRSGCRPDVHIAIRMHEGASRQRSDDEPKRGTRTRVYARIAGHVIAAVTVIAAAQQWRQYAPTYLGLMAVGLLLTIIAHAALSSEKVEGGAIGAWLAVLVVGVGLATWAAKPPVDVPDGPDAAKNEIAERKPGAGAQPETTTKPREENGIVVEDPIPVGPHATAMSEGPDGLWMPTSSMLANWDPARPDSPPRSIGFGRRAFDLATTEYLVIAVSGPGATAYFTDKKTGREARGPLRFGEQVGHVATSENTVWLCNVSQSKIDWLDLETGEVGTTSVPGVPRAILVVGGAVFVAVNIEDGSADQGWLVRIGRESHREEARVPIPSGPTALAFGFGDVWVAFGDSGLVNRVDPTGAMSVREKDIYVAADVQALAVAADSVFALGRATKQIDRIDPERDEVVAHEKLELGREKGRTGIPGDLVSLRETLWVTDASWGTVSRVTVMPAARANPAYR